VSHCEENKADPTKARSQQTRAFTTLPHQWYQRRLDSWLGLCILLRGQNARELCCLALSWPLLHASMIRHAFARFSNQLPLKHSSRSSRMKSSRKSVCQTTPATLNGQRTPDTPRCLA